MIDEEEKKPYFLMEAIKSLTYEEIKDRALKYIFDSDMVSCVWKTLNPFIKEDYEEITTASYYIVSGFMAGIQYALENFPTYNEEAAGEQEERSENDT